MFFKIATEPHFFFSLQKGFNNYNVIFATTVICNISVVFYKPILVESRFRVRRNTWRYDHSGMNFCFKGNEG